MKKSVLILDDQENIRYDLKRFIEQENYIVYAVSTIKSALEIVRLKKIDFAVIDLKIDFRSEYGGIEMIIELNRIQPKTRVVIVSAYELNIELEKQLSNIEYHSYVSKGGERNYIESVIQALEDIKTQTITKKCFVIMPFSNTTKCSSNEWEDIFENMIKPSVENSGYDFNCFRTNLLLGNIIVDILDNLNKSDVVIADLTDKNPNVYYELGVRHALRDATILITQSIDDVPFDLRPYALIIYDWKTKKGKDTFSTSIRIALENIEKNEKNIASPVREYLKLTF